MTISQLYNCFAGIRIYNCVNNHIVSSSLGYVLIFTRSVAHPCNLKFKSYSKMDMSYAYSSLVQYYGPIFTHKIKLAVSLCS